MYNTSNTLICEQIIYILIELKKAYLNLSYDTLSILTPSILITPLETSTNLNKASIREDLPAPVLPTTPILSAGLVSKETFLRDIGR